MLNTNMQACTANYALPAITGDALAWEACLIASLALTPIATVLTNPRLHDNPIIGVNDAFCALTGYAPNEIVGQNCRFLSKLDGNAVCSDLVRESLIPGRACLSVVVNYRKDGSCFRNALMIAPIKAADGTVAYFVGSQMEVNDQATPFMSARVRKSAELASCLSVRQKQVLALMVDGRRNKQIAWDLGIGEKTVKMHRHAVMVKLEASTTAEVIRIGLEASMLE